MDDNKKFKIWVYAIILFTSAFVILLLTAYSQIKLNRNLNEYKNQVYTKETENKKVMQNFSSAQEMNIKLNAEIKRLQEENNALKIDLSDLEAERAFNEAREKKREAAEYSLANAVNTYLKGNVIECAAMIGSIDYAALEGKEVETYKALSAKVKSEAGKMLTDEGYALYKKGKYSDAAKKLSLAYKYAPSDVFTDKTLFYLAYSEFKLGNKQDALVNMNKLIYNFPNSGYLRSAKKFVGRYQK